MIHLVTELPDIYDKNSAELIKIKCLFEAYSDIALFWVQDGTSTLISMLDSNMMIYAKNPDFEELKSFIDVIAPKSIFTDFKTAKKLNLKINEMAVVLKRNCDIPFEASPDELKSDEIYAILNVEGLTLPPFDTFAVDFCHRKNIGQLKCFAKAKTFAAISISLKDICLINGISSSVKGQGSVALKGILSQNFGKIALVCAKEEIINFYIKNGFKELYKAAYCSR